MITLDVTKPPSIHRYSERRWLDRSLRLGEFRLRPASDYLAVETDLARCDDEQTRIYQLTNPIITDVSTGQRIHAVGPVTRRSRIETNYYLLCFSSVFDTCLYDEFPGADACLTIKDVEAFSDRVHAAAREALPRWAGIDAKGSYGYGNNLGVPFNKPEKFVFHHEYRFAWIPYHPVQEDIAPILIKIGCIEDIAELVTRD